MRRLTIRFLGPNDRRPKATITFTDEIPSDLFEEICRWASLGGQIWGRERKRLAINVIKTAAGPEPAGHGAAQEISEAEDVSPCHDRAYCDEQDPSGVRCIFYDECNRDLGTRK